jgi:uncharacterized protein YjbI with pentapeptide repeats
MRYMGILIFENSFVVLDAAPRLAGISVWAAAHSARRGVEWYAGVLSGVGAVMWCPRMAPVHLMGVYLTGVYLTGVLLMGVYLINVHLTSVRLMNEHLKSVCLGVCLMGVYLMGVHLMGVYLMGVHLTGVYVPHGRGATS